MYNPVTGRRFVKTWMADTIFPFAVDIYHKLEELTSGKFLYPRKIIRSLSAETEFREWKKKASRPEYKPYLHETDDVSELPARVEIKGGGNLDVSQLIKTMGDYFRKSDLLISEKLIYRDIQFRKQDIQWSNIQTQSVIFCEGYKAMWNPWFETLPFTHAKGELLTIHAPDLKQHHILSKGVFILPIGNDLYKVGATYDWDDLTTGTTEAAKRELQLKLGKILNCSYTIHEHKAGIRPTVRDRRPLIGLHPEDDRLGIFNGLGTKGVSLAPYFASHFAAHLEEGTPLLSEVDMRRFSSRKRKKADG
ncbi:MAG: FAD-dependent oxidoreductase [bacterium]